MTDREALVAAVAVRPEEDTPRLAFTDWLEENNQPLRAEFVRVQCEAAHKRAGTRRRAELLNRADTLLKHADERLRLLADPSVLPRLRQVEVYSSFGNEQPELEAIRARFGLRLNAW